MLLFQEQLVTRLCFRVETDLSSLPALTHPHLLLTWVRKCVYLKLGWCQKTKCDVV